MAEEALIDGCYFSATKAGLPDLHFAEYNDELDHGWHEVHAFQPTYEAPNDPEHRTIEELVESLRSASVVR